MILLKYILLKSKRRIYPRGTSRFMIDGGSQITICNDIKFLHNYREEKPSFNAESFSGHSLDLRGYGYLILNFDDFYFQLQCWYQPDAAINLISGCYLDDNDCMVNKINSDPNEYVLQYKQRSIPIITVDGLKFITSSEIILPPEKKKIYSVHTRLGHINATYLLRSDFHGTIQGINEDDRTKLRSFYTEHDCTSCLLGKARRANAVESSRDRYIDVSPFSIVYSDVCQITEVLQPNRQKYLVTFKCASSNFLKIYPIEKKSDVYFCIIAFVNWVRNQFHDRGYRVLKLFTDQGSEYMSQQVQELLAQEGIESQTTSAYTPQSNGVAERVNLTIMNDVRSMLISSSLPSYFWVEAALYSVYLRNHIYMDKLKTSPAMFIGFDPLNIDDVHEFGERCYVTSLPYGGKTDMRGALGIYLGRSAAVFGHRVFVPTQNGTVDAGYFLCTRHVEFNKVPKLYFAYPHDKQHENTLFTLFDNPMHIGLEQNRERDVNLDEYLFSKSGSKRDTQITDGDSDLMDVDYSSDSDVSMDDYHEDKDDDDEDLDDENFQLSTSTLHDDADMELPVINEKELLEDTNYLLTDMIDTLEDKMNTSNTESIQMFQQGLNGQGRHTRSSARARLGPVGDQDPLEGLSGYETNLAPSPQVHFSDQVMENVATTTNDSSHPGITDPVGVLSPVTGSTTTASLQEPLIQAMRTPPEANVSDHQYVNIEDSVKETTNTKLALSQPSNDLSSIQESVPSEPVTHKKPTLMLTSNETAEDFTSNPSESSGTKPKLSSKSSKTKRTKPTRKPIKKDSKLKKSSDTGKLSTAKSSTPEPAPPKEEVMLDSERPSTTETADAATKSHSHWDQDKPSILAMSQLSPQHSRRKTDSKALEDDSITTTQYTASRNQDATPVPDSDISADAGVTKDSPAANLSSGTPSSTGLDKPVTMTPFEITNDDTAVARRTRSKQTRAFVLDDRVLGKNVSSKVRKPKKKKATSAKDSSMVNPRKVDKLPPAVIDTSEDSTPLVNRLHNVEPLAKIQPEHIPPVPKSNANKLQSMFENAPMPENPTSVGDDVFLTQDQREGTTTPARRTSQRLKNKLIQKMKDKNTNTPLPPKPKVTARPSLRRSLPRAAKAGKHVVKKVNFVMVTNINVKVPIQAKTPFPKTYQSAMNSVDHIHWKAATDAEFSSHAEQTTWDPKPIFVAKDSPLLKKTIMTKWVFTIKSDGTYKARLVARGDLQDDSTYDITYSPTLRPEIARSIFAQNVTNGWFFKQFDFKTAYLNSLLNTEIYIYAPAGYSKHKSKSDPNKRVIFKLNRGLYGLKQAGRLWHLELSKTLAKIGYKRHDAFPSTFIKKGRNGQVICVIGLFVDDMIVSTKEKSEMQKLSNFLSEHYKLKEIQADEDGMQRFLGMNLKVERCEEGKTLSININQSEYIQSIIDEYNVEYRPKIKTPLPPGFYFDSSLPENQLASSDAALKVAKHEYRKKIGLLLYISVMTRPDITYAVNYLAQFCEYPHPALFTIIGRLFEYLRNTQYFSIRYEDHKSELMEIFTDSDYAQEPTTRRSMNGYLIRLNGNIVHWKSKYTALMCTSSTEAELQAIFIASNEGIWFRQLCVFIGLFPRSQVGKYRVDNRSIVDAINNDNFSATSKHYAVRLQTVKERLKEPDLDDTFSTGKIRFDLNHISGEDQLADILTKPITVKVLEKLIPLIMNTILG